MAYISFQPKDYFNTLLWTGDGTSPRSLTGIGFQPDWTIIKKRNTAASHVVFDAVRTAGSTKGLATNSNAIEGLTATEGTTANYGYVSSFDSDGFTVTAGALQNAYVNNTSDNYVSWNWRASGTSGSSNTDGSITSTVSANTTSGFSIVKYTGTGANATVGTGLGVAPSIVLCKNLSASGNWIMYHSALGATKYMVLNDTDAQATATGAWNDTAPTSSVFSVGTGSTVNGSGNNLVAYCFAPVRGFSSMGSYIGNGSTDGSFIYTGMSPAFIMVKRTNTTEGWYMYDVKRDTFNVSDAYLTANTSNAEATLTNGLDILSNGFKMRNTDTGHNASGSTYIYMAFSDQSIVSSNGIPAVAR